MNFILTAVLLCAFGATNEDEYLGRIAYRAQTQRNYSYEKEKSDFLKLSETDRRAVIYAENILSQQRRAMYQGTPWMRIEQTTPVRPIQPRVYPQPWDSPIYRPFYPYPAYASPVYNPNIYYHVIIR